MSGFQRYSTLPDNADKVLFAEDFVNHLLLRFKLPLLSSGIANRRASIYNAFNAEVKLAANYVYGLLEQEMAEEFENVLKQNNTIDINAFLKYVVPLKFHTIMHPVELGAQNLMRFCVKISSMAVKFYTLGFLDAPILAVDYIISIINEIDMVDGGWVALNILATNYAQKLVEKDNLTPESSPDHDTEYDSLSTLSSRNSEVSSSPDHEMNVGDGQDEHPEELSDSDYCNFCIAALSSPPEEPVSSIHGSKHVERKNDVKADNIARLSDNMSDSGSSEPSIHHSSTSFHSFEVTSSEEDRSKQKIRKKQNKKASCMHPIESDSDSDKYEADLKITKCIDPLGGQLTEKSSAILSSPVIKNVHESDSAHFKTPDSDNFTSEDLNTSSVEEGGRVQSLKAKSSPLRKHIPKRRK